MLSVESNVTNTDGSILLEESLQGRAARTTCRVFNIGPIAIVKSRTVSPKEELITISRVVSRPEPEE